MLRIDAVELDNVAGLRFNVWTSIVLFVLAAVYFVWSLRARPGRETSLYVEGAAGGRAGGVLRAVPRRPGPGRGRR